MIRYFLPIVVSVVFIADSLFVNFFANQSWFHQWILSPKLTLIVLLLATIYINPKKGIQYAFFFGLLYDIVYTDLLGVYMFGMPAICYIVSKLLKVFQTNVVIITILTIVGITLLEFYVYEINSMIGLTHMSMDRFLTYRLYPTLILNLVFVVLLAYPLKKQFEKVAYKLTD
ncbi:rod shape-determining protein MreD [Priestia endophytica]|uniref:rod shape-determining protein MreD n=1 Tax=Priestia endophytica TaxID=135735 RepID=UPI00227EBD0E|nr:rod shape-determining protein MreD [Priestia endophytica]MCY8233646.1 rod shape-determining protein MreD [Priestia endophytica]